MAAHTTTVTTRDGRLELVFIVPTGRRPVRVRVSSRHPEVGMVYRGQLLAAGHGGLKLAWRVQDYDHLDLDVHTGDFLDVVKILLDATTEMEAENPDPVTYRL